MTLRSIRWMLKLPSSMAFFLKKYISFNHLDMRILVKNTKCVTFCRPLMGSNKLPANGMKYSPHIFSKLYLFNIRLIKMFTSSMTTKKLFSLGSMWMTLFYYLMILFFSKLLKFNFHKLLKWPTMVNCIIILVYKSLGTAINIWYTLIKTNMCYINLPFMGWFTINPYPLLWLLAQN